MKTEDIKYINPDNWTSGIYKITSPNGHYYYGSTSNFRDRCFKTHFVRLRGGRHENQYIQNVYNKYPVGWVFEAIEYVDNTTSALRLAEEKYLIHVGRPLCMNINPSASRPPCRKGIKQTTEHTLKIKNANKGKKRSFETRQRISESHKGYKHTKAQTAK